MWLNLTSLDKYRWKALKVKRGRRGSIPNYREYRNNFFTMTWGVLHFSRVQTLVYNDKAAVLLLELNLHFPRVFQDRVLFLLQSSKYVP